MSQPFGPQPGELYPQEGAAPTRKMKAVGIAGALTTVLLGVAKYAGVPMEAEFASALVALVMFGAGWAVQERAP